MKLRLPSLLCSALLACMACASTANAATFTTDGVYVDKFEYGYDTDYQYQATLGSNTDRFYDGGKGSQLWVTRGDIDSGEQYPDKAYEIYTNNGNDLKVFGVLADDITANSNGLNFSKLNSNDSGHCWAYTASNMFQYWQSYYGVFAKKVGDTTAKTPIHGYSYDEQYVATLGGAQSLKLNKFFYDNCNNAGGTASEVIGWYMDGVTEVPGADPLGTLSSLKTNAEGGYFSQYFDSAASACNSTDYFFNDRAGNLTLEELSASIKSHFGVTQAQDGSYQQTTKGQILYLELRKDGGVSHAVTCYGFETDSDGNITALYIVNSDDKGHRLVKVYGKATDRGFELYTTSDCASYATYNNWRVAGWSSINTTVELQNMLTEYESGAQTWMGTEGVSWKNSYGDADPNELPTDATGWMAYAGTGTEHAGYYNTYYSSGRGVEFNDEAASTSVSVAEDISVASMAVNNEDKAYSFNGGESTKTITISGDFTKSGSGALEFSNIKLIANSADLGGDTTFDQLALSGNLKANGHTVTLKGDASFNNIDTTQGETGLGTSSLVITGGTTAIKPSTAEWVNIKNLTLSEEARLTVSNASLSVAGNIDTTTTTTGQLAEGVEAGIDSQYCIKVGTMEDGKVKEGTGNVTLAGSLKSGAYIYIMGNLDITGNLSQTGADDKNHVTIIGNADVDGNFSAEKPVTIGGYANIGGNATMEGTASITGALTVSKDLTLQGDTTVGGKLTADNISLAASKTLNAKGGLSVTGEMTLATGSTLTLGDGAPTATTHKAEAEATISHASITATSISGSSAEAPAELNNVHLTLAKDGTLELTHVTLGADTLISGDNSVLRVNGVTLLLGDSNLILSNTLTQMPLTLGEEELTQRAPESSLALLCTSLEGVTLEGDAITFDFSQLSEEDRAIISESDSFSLSFTEDVVFSDAKNVQMKLDENTTYTLTQVADAPGSFTFNKAGQAIPEPATATLSLLALAALAARRRRK